MAGVAGACEMRSPGCGLVLYLRPGTGLPEHGLGSTAQRLLSAAGQEGSAHIKSLIQRLGFGF